VHISVEHGDQRKRGRNGSWTQLGPPCGTLLATGVIALMTYLYTADEFLAWGWRIPFLSSVALVLFGFWIRRGVGETPMFKELEESGTTAKTPIGDVLRLHWRRLLIAGGVRVGTDVTYTLVFVFTLTYVTTILDLSRTLALTALMIATPVSALAMPMFGALSDRIGRRPVYAGGVIAAMFWAFGFFVMLDTKDPLLIVAAVVVGVVPHAAMFGTQAAFVIEQFPTRVRYAGSSLAYTLAGIVGAGFAPLIMATLLRAYGNTFVVSLYVVGALAMTAVALWAARETSRLPLED
jgi:MFS family permease